MNHPSFFDHVPAITMHDPLAQLLGAAADGLIEYSYAEIVKLAGHSCPTVAGAYLMTLKALNKLYGDELPERGAIRVDFRDSQRNGVTGVIANVASFVTGATSDNGFKGLGGKYDRRGLLFFDVPIEGEIRFQRLDTGAQATVSFHSGVVPASSNLMPALHNILGASASQDQQRDFAAQWQDRVRRIFENADHPGLITFA